MNVQWKYPCWPEPINAFLRAVKARCAYMGILQIDMDEPRALGQMDVTDEKGVVCLRLNDSIQNRRKLFFVPMKPETPFCIAQADGAVLYSTLAAAPPAAAPPQSEDGQ